MVVAGVVENGVGAVTVSRSRLLSREGGGVLNLYSANFTER